VLVFLADALRHAPAPAAEHTRIEH
jgi:hypothetical protein